MLSRYYRCDLNNKCPEQSLETHTSAKSWANPEGPAFPISKHQHVPFQFIPSAPRASLPRTPPLQPSTNWSFMSILLIQPRMFHIVSFENVFWLVCKHYNTGKTNANSCIQMRMLPVKLWPLFCIQASPDVSQDYLYIPGCISSGMQSSSLLHVWLTRNNMSLFPCDRKLFAWLSDS